MALNHDYSDHGTGCRVHNSGCEGDCDCSRIEKSPLWWIVCPICSFTRGYDLDHLMCRNCRAYTHRTFKVRQVIGIAYDAFLEGRSVEAAKILAEVAGSAVSPTGVVEEWGRFQASGRPPKHR